jgi:hypothetical protein
MNKLKKKPYIKTKLSNIDHVENCYRNLNTTIYTQ